MAVTVTSEEMLRVQHLPEGHPDKEAQRTRADPATGETLIPDSCAAVQAEELERWVGAGVTNLPIDPPPEGDEDNDFADRLRDGLEQQARGNPALLGVGRNVGEEPLVLVRMAEAATVGTGTNPAKRYVAQLGGPGDGAPVLEPSGGAKHHLGAPWPAPLTHSCDAPTASPAPGPEPDFQINPPQPITFAEHEAAVIAVAGPSAADQRAAELEQANRLGLPVDENAALDTQHGGGQP